MSSSNRSGFNRDDTTGALMVQGVADRDNGQLGLVAPQGPQLAAVGSRAIPAGPTTWYCRAVPSRSMTITRIGFLVTVAASLDDPVSVGIYDATGTRIATSVATTGQLNSTGVKSANLVTPVTLDAGQVYYAALSSPTATGTAATLAGVSGPGASAPGLTLFGTTIPQADGASSSAHPVPATMTGYTTGSFGAVPLLTLRES